MWLYRQIAMITTCMLISVWGYTPGTCVDKEQYWNGTQCVGYIGVLSSVFIYVHKDAGSLESSQVPEFVQGGVLVVSLSKAFEKVGTMVVGKSNIAVTIRLLQQVGGHVWENEVVKTGYVEGSHYASLLIRPHTCAVLNQYCYPSTDKATIKCTQSGSSQPYASLMFSSFKMQSLIFDCSHSTLGMSPYLEKCLQADNGNYVLNIGQVRDPQQASYCSHKVANSTIEFMSVDFINFEYSLHKSLIGFKSPCENSSYPKMSLKMVFNNCKFSNLHSCRPVVYLQTNQTSQQYSGIEFEMNGCEVMNVGSRLSELKVKEVVGSSLPKCEDVLKGVKSQFVYAETRALNGLKVVNSKFEGISTYFTCTSNSISPGQIASLFNIPSITPPTTQTPIFFKNNTFIKSQTNLALIKIDLTIKMTFTLDTNKIHKNLGNCMAPSYLNNALLGIQLVSIGSTSEMVLTGNEWKDNMICKGNLISLKVLSTVEGYSGGAMLDGLGRFENNLLGHQSVLIQVEIKVGVGLTLKQVDFVDNSDDMTGLLSRFKQYFSYDYVHTLPYTEPTYASSLIRITTSVLTSNFTLHTIATSGTNFIKPANQASHTTLSNLPTSKSQLLQSDSHINSLTLTNIQITSLISYYRLFTFKTLTHVSINNLQYHNLTFRQTFYKPITEFHMLNLQLDASIKTLEITGISIKQTFCDMCIDTIRVLLSSSESMTISNMIIQGITYNTTGTIAPGGKSVDRLPQNSLVMLKIQDISLMINNFTCDSVIVGNHGCLTIEPQKTTITTKPFNLTSSTFSNVDTHTGSAIILQNQIHQDIYFTNLTFTNNSCLTQSADMYLRNSKVRVYIKDSKFTNPRQRFLVPEQIFLYAQSMLLEGVTYIHISNSIWQGPGVGINGTNPSIYSNQTYTKEFNPLFTSAIVVTNVDKLVFVNNIIQDFLAGSYFLDGAGGAAIKANFAEVEIYNCLIKNNAVHYGGGFLFESTQVIIKNTQFVNNMATSDGGALLTRYAEITLMENVLFTNNLAWENGGAINALSTNIKMMKNVTFEHNRLQGEQGVTISLYQTNINMIQGSIFRNNYAISETASNTILGFTAIITMKDVQFINNHGGNRGTDGILINQKGLLIMTNCTFTSDVHTKAKREFNVLKLSGYQSKFGGYIRVMTESSMIIQNSTFINGFAHQGGAIYFQGQHYFSFTGCRFEGNSAVEAAGAIVVYQYETFKSLNSPGVPSVFRNNYLQDVRNDGEDISVVGRANMVAQLLNIRVEKDFSTLNPIQLTKQGYSIYIKQGKFQIAYAVFTSTNQSIPNSGIYFESPQELLVLKCNFTNLMTNTYGAGIQIDQTTQTSTTTLTIQGSRFESTIGQIAGAVLISNVPYTIVGSTYKTDVSIKGCHFVRNRAEIGRGGAISFQYIQQTGWGTSRLILDGNVFDRNQAQQGGAYGWTSVKPIEVGGNSFIGNVGKIYANNKGGVPLNVVEVTKQEFQASSPVFVNSTRRMLVGSEYNKIIPNVGSGHRLPTFYLAVVDQDGQIVSSYTSEGLKLLYDDPINNANSPYTLSLSSESISTTTRGRFNFSNIEIVGTPGKSDPGYTITTNQDSRFTSRAQPLLGSLVKSFKILIQMRKCLSGEEFWKNGKCVPCPEKYKYLLIAPTQPTICKQCPLDRANCFGMNIIGPKPSFWRSSSTSDNFLLCYNIKACLGRVLATQNTLGECQVGYHGILCSGCKMAYSRVGDFRCQGCPKEVYNVIRLSLSLIGAVIMIVVMIRSTLAGARQKKKLTSVYFKIMMNHIQLILLTSRFEFDWPPEVKEFFNTTKPVSQQSKQIISIDCFIKTSQNSSYNLFYQKMTIMAVMPFVVAISTFITINLACIRRPRRYRNSLFLSSLIITLFLIHPNVVQSMFENFDCDEIQGVRRIREDLNHKCWQSYHTLYSLLISFPGVVIWGFGIPILAILVLTKHRFKLNKIEIRYRYGFLYNGYRTKYYYWESIIMIRKIIIIGIKVFGQSFGTITQAMVVQLLISLFIGLNIRLAPFSFQNLNFMETVSLISQGLTVYCGIFYLSDHPEIYSNEDMNVRAYHNGLQISRLENILLFLIIILSNAVFFIYWMVKMVGEAVQIVRKSFPRVYVMVCLCNNKTRLRQEKQRQEEVDEHLILRQKLDHAIEQVQQLYEQREIQLNQKTLEKIMVYLHPNKIKKYVQSKSEIDTQREMVGEVRLSRDEGSLDVEVNQMFDDTKAMLKIDMMECKERMEGVESVYLDSNIDEEVKGVDEEVVDFEELWGGISDNKLN